MAVIDGIDTSELSPGEISLLLERKRALDEQPIKVDRMAAARAGKAAKLAAKNAAIAAGTYVAPDEAADRAVWMSIFLTLMKTKEVKGMKDIKALFPLVDEAMEAIEEHRDN